ncbi:MAG: cytochrome b/b6 domain-containing protein [Burkholderiaceae bacterium]|nr:cytochrome b/b6 domain-containing protein [Burkholderiaceae bacterium]
MSSPPSPDLRRVRVWDLPTRLFHWLLLACVVGAVVTAKLGGNAVVWHFRFGAAVLALLAFRLVWGLIGGRWSRFSAFVHSPAAFWRYLRGRARPDEHLDVGHNPLGALSVFALLAVLVLQVATGLVADDEIANTGPLVAHVSGALSSQATTWHKTFGQWLLFALVGLHLAAILFYRVAQGRDLVGPMLHGDKLLEVPVPAAADGLPQRLLALAVAAASAALATWVLGLGG